MAEVKHTHGPWSLGGIAFPKSDRPLVNVWGPQDGRASGQLVCKDASVPDGQLITAAPQLQTVAQLFIDTIHAVENRCMAADGPVTATCDEITDAELRAIYVAAVAALAKATGEAPPALRGE
jgi:hypothetical protein